VSVTPLFETEVGAASNPNGPDHQDKRFIPHMFLVANILCFRTDTQYCAHTKYFGDARTMIVSLTTLHITAALDVSAGTPAVPSRPYERLHGCAVVLGDR
jgi:hypothetical protein